MQNTPKHPLLVVAILIALIGSITSLWAVEPESPLAIKGYSPVSYFENDRAEKGNPEFSATFNQRTYLFTNAEQLARFKADPRRYEPLFPEHCPYNLTLGRQAAIDPENFKIVNGNLLLFHRDEEMDGREMWESHGDDEELLERAKSQYTLFRF